MLNVYSSSWYQIIEVMWGILEMCVFMKHNYMNIKGLECAVNEIENDYVCNNKQAIGHQKTQQRQCHQAKNKGYLKS